MTTSTTKTKRPKSEHVLLRPPGTFLCLRCGESYAMELPAPVNILLGAMQAFSATHKKCKIGVRGLACMFCFGFGHAEDDCPKRKYHGDYREWMAGPDTGMSSMALCRKLAGITKRAPLESSIKTTSERVPSSPIPVDADDFGRCHRLLHAIPGWRARIGEMRGEGQWAPLVDAWDELERLYLAELGKQEVMPKRFYPYLNKLRGR